MRSTWKLYITSLSSFVMKYSTFLKHIALMSVQQLKLALVSFFFFKNITEGKVLCNNLIVADGAVMLLPYS